MKGPPTSLRFDHNCSCTKGLGMTTDREANYRGVYENRIGFGRRPALLLVDFVQAYFEPTCDLYAGVEDALSSAIRIRDQARVARVPVVYTNVVYQNGALN